MNSDEIRKRAEAITWWHDGIDLGHGVITSGRHAPLKQLLPYLNLPQDLSGLTCLDIGTWDGFMAFECEQRGASKVVALDSWAWEQPHGRDGFDLACEALGSKIVPVHCDILDMDPDRLGTFDVVLFLGVLYHMRHPLLALEKVAGVCHGMLLMETHVSLDQVDKPFMRFYPGTELNGDSTNWWGPNVTCVMDMLQSVGFEHCTFQSAYADRAVFHAWRKHG